MKKKILLLMMVIAMVTLSSSATKIYVCGTKITGSTNFSTSGGTVSYDDNTRVLTITNVNYTKSGSSNNGISVDELSGDLTINLYGTVKFTIADADAVLCKCLNKLTIINVYGTAEFITKSSDHAGLKLQDCDVSLRGGGSLTIKNTSSSSSANAIKGGTNNENLSFYIKECTIESNGPRLNKLHYVSIYHSDDHLSGEYSDATTMIRLKPGSSNTAHQYGIHNWADSVRVFLPIDYYGRVYHTINDNDLSGKEVVLSDYKPAVIINSSYFPDNNLLDHLRYLEPQGYLTTSQMNNYTYLNLSGLNISNVAGLYQFANLKELRLQNNNLTTLLGSEGWLGGLPNSLQIVNCSNNKITSLSGLSSCSSLKTLDCSNNQISSINGLPCSNLESLNASNNKFTSIILSNSSGYSLYCPKLSYLNLSNCTQLTELWSYGPLTTLNVSGCSKLEIIRCENNKISSLSALPSSLKALIVNGNQLTSLPSIPSSLQYLWVSNNKLTSFSLSNHSNIQSISIDGNPITTATVCNNSALTTLNLNNCSAMTTLSCYNNQLSSLNLSGCSSLQTLDCSTNKITSLDLSPCSALKNVYANNNLISTVPTFSSSNKANLELLGINGNKLTSCTMSGFTKMWALGLSNNPNLTTVDVNNNSAMTTLELQNCPALTTLKCNYNKISSLSYASSASGGLKLYNSYAVKTFNCSYNQLTSLDVSSLSNLTELNCSWNKLSSLNVSNKTKLTQLQAHYNQLTSLNVQGCSSLNYLMLESNKFTSLSVQGCNALRTINCCLNKISASGANTLINSLCTIPSGSQGTLRYIFPGYNSGSYVENNVNLTDAQVRSARNKRWIPYKFTGSGWVEIPINTAVPGDVNGDGTVTAADITALYDVLLNNDYSQIVNGDQTGDGIITAADVTAVYTIMLSSKE